MEMPFQVKATANSCAPHLLLGKPLQIEQVVNCPDNNLGSSEFATYTVHEEMTDVLNLLCEIICITWSTDWLGGLHCDVLTNIWSAFASLDCIGHIALF